MIALLQIEARIEHYESAIIDLYEGIQEDSEIVDLILADGDTPRRKSMRLRIVRRGIQRSKEAIALYERALANLEADRLRYLASEIID